MFLTVNVSYNAYGCHNVHFVAKFIWSRTYVPKLLFTFLPLIRRQGLAPIYLFGIPESEVITSKVCKTRVFGQCYIGKLPLWWYSKSYFAKMKCSWICNFGPKFLGKYFGICCSDHSYNQCHRCDNCHTG